MRNKADFKYLDYRMYAAETTAEQLHWARLITKRHPERWRGWLMLCISAKVSLGGLAEESILSKDNEAMLIQEVRIAANKLRGLKPDNFLGYAILPDTLRDSGRPGEAALEYLKITKGTKAAGALFHLYARSRFRAAECYAYLGKLNEALAAIDEAIASAEELLESGKIDCYLEEYWRDKASIHKSLGDKDAMQIAINKANDRAAIIDAYLDSGDFSTGNHFQL